jgi:hypothetical protein
MLLNIPGNQVPGALADKLDVLSASIESRSP